MVSSTQAAPGLYILPLFSLLVRTKSSIAPFFISLGEERYHQHIPGTSWTTCVLLCCPKRYWHGWSPQSDQGLWTQSCFYLSIVWLIQGVFLVGWPVVNPYYNAIYHILQGAAVRNQCTKSEKLMFWLSLWEVSKVKWILHVFVLCKRHWMEHCYVNLEN